MVAPLLPHLFKGIREVECADLFGILELEELIASVASHVDEDIGIFVCEKALAARHLVAHAVGEKPDEVLDCHFISTVVHLDVGAVEIDGSVGIGVYGPRERIARVAGHVIGKHEDDLGVRDAQALHCAVEGEDIGEMAVVEPEARGSHEDGPVGGVFCGGGGKEGEGDGEEEGERELHGDGVEGGVGVESWRSR